jgi:uncharacterized protein involved in exopolysaccharide biosynthesis
MSAELNGNSPTYLSLTPRELAATLFRRPRIISASFGLVLVATLLFVFFSARYESHFKVLLRRGRFDPVVSSQPASTMDFTRPDITEEELNSEVELLRDEDLLKQVVKMAELVPADTSDYDRPAEIEHAVRKLARRLDVEALKKSNLIQVSYKDTSPERAARVLSALSTVYVQRHTNLQRPTGEIQFFDIPSRSVTLKRWADNPEVLEKMKTHLLELQLKRTELLSRFEPSYRLVQEIEQEIAETRAEIAAEALTPVRDETSDKDPNYEWARLEMEKAQVQRDGLRARQSDASTQVAALHTFAERMQSDSMDQQDLTRTAKVEEDNYLLYLRKREEARIGDALDERRILNVAIVEPPVEPALAVHSAFLYFLLAFVLAMAFSIGVAFTTEYFDPTIRTPDEAYSLLEVPVLAWLPAPDSALLGSSMSRIGQPKVVLQ